MTTRARTVIRLIVWVGLSLLAGGVGSIASANAREFYAQLVKPGWSPPGSVFGPVWTTLFILMGIAAFLVAQSPPSRQRRIALITFVVQLVLNALWSWLFFAWRLGAGAFVEIVVLWLVIAALIVMFARIHKVAAVLLVPYLAWVTFATALTWAIWQLNPALLR